MTDGDDPFGRLSSAIQYQIVNGLGFRELRPVQLNAIGPIVDGENCVVLAPTAGGKTEAAFFPILSRMDQEDHPNLTRTNRFDAWEKSIRRFRDGGLRGFAQDVVDPSPRNGGLAAQCRFSDCSLLCSLR